MKVVLMESLIVSLVLAGNNESFRVTPCAF